METCERKQSSNFKVLRLPNYLPLEIWGAIADGAPLYQNHYPTSGLKVFLENLRRGEAQFTNESSLDISSLASNFKDVHFLGGASQTLDPHDFEDSQFDVHFHPSPQWAGVEGLKKLSSSFNTPLLIDWGQTSIKISFTGERILVDRDLDLFPISPPGRCSESLSDRLREYYLELISKFDADSIFLSVPVEVLEDERARGCSIPGLGYNIKSLFQLTNRPTFVLNDALAASCSLDLEKQNRKSLVLTLGFAMGGCLFQPQS